MIAAIRTLIRFLRKRDVKNWRLHRKACIALLPKGADESAQ